MPNDNSSFYKFPLIQKKVEKDNHLYKTKLLMKKDKYI